MFELFRNWFRPAGRDEGDDREGLRRAVAALVYEVTRMDFEVRPEDLATARAALGDLLEITDGEAHDLLQHAGDAGNRLTSYH